MQIRAELFLWASRFVVTPNNGTGLSRVIVQPHPDGGAWVWALNGERAAIFHDAAGVVDGQTFVLPVKPLVAACKLDKKKPGKLLRLVNGRLQVDQGSAGSPLYIETDPGAMDPGGLIAPTGYPDQLLAEVERIFSTPQNRPFIAIRPDAFALFDFEGRGLIADLATDGACIRVTSPELPEFTGIVMCLTLGSDAPAATPAESSFDDGDNEEF